MQRNTLVSFYLESQTSLKFEDYSPKDALMPLNQFAYVYTDD